MFSKNISSSVLVKRLFSFYSLSAIRVVSSAYLRLLMFLLAILIPACDSSSPAFHMMCCLCKLNKQRDNIQPWHTSFPILNKSVVPSPVLIVIYLLEDALCLLPTMWQGTPTKRYTQRSFFINSITLRNCLSHYFYILIYACSSACVDMLLFEDLFSKSV